MNANVKIPGNSATIGESENDDMFIVTGRGTEEAINYLNGLFRRALRDNFADIHFQKTPKFSRIRTRIPGGDLIDIDHVNPDWMTLYSDKIRSKAKVSTTDHRAPLDGRMSFTISGTTVDVRVSITPGVNDGFLIVCRIQNQANSQKRLDDIEMPLSAKETFRNVINEPHGLFLITGPTGSGKTTTLYALLNELNNGKRNIITIENPVEYTNPDFHQINVDEDAMTFGAALRSVLRQDPDVIMVGEIRDQETAQIAVQAANTGHLVLSTLHANTAPSAIYRLVEDFGIEPGKLSSALRCVIAQRLVRTFKKDFAITRRTPTDLEKTWLRAYRIPFEGKTYAEAGNPLSDYKGYAPIMEIIVADSRVKKAISQGEQVIAMAASRQFQYDSLGRAAERMAAEGRIPLEEAMHVASAQDAPGITNKRLGELLVDAKKITEIQLREILEKQIQLRLEGRIVQLGRLFVEEGLCSAEEVTHLIGYTSEAYEIIQNHCNTVEAKEQLQDLVSRWAPGITSLFTQAIQAGLITQGDIQNAYEN